MDHKSVCNHSNCNATSPNESLRQTILEMDWERGIWNAGEKDRVLFLINKGPKDLVNKQDNSGYSALHYAARNGHIDICRILIENGGFVNALTRNGNATPLHKAAVAGKEATVKYLIQHGAQLDLQDADGKTALHKVVENKKYELIDVLLEACPNLKYIKDNKGNLAIE